MLSVEEMNEAATALYSPVTPFEPASNTDHAEMLITWHEALGWSVSKEFVKGRGKNPSFYRVTTTSGLSTFIRTGSALAFAITAVILFAEGVDNV